MTSTANRYCFCILLIGSLICANMCFADTSVSKMWSKLDPKWENLFRLIDQQKKAPDSAILAKDKASYQKKIDKLLDEAIAIIGDSPSLTAITEIRSRYNYIEQRQQAIADLRTRKAMDPDKDYTKDIEKEEQRIANSKREIENLKGTLVSQLDGIGIKLTKEEADSLVSSVTGEDDARMFTAFYNIKLFTERLKKLVGETGENIAIAKKYYGMHTVLLMTLLHLHDIYIGKIEQSYIPKIKEIIAHNKKQQSETKALIKGSDGAHKASFKSNLESQETTGRAAALYLVFLEKRKNKVTESRKKVHKEWTVAVNTFNTVTAAQLLISLMKESETFYKSLTELQIPDLLTFTNAEMKDQFQKLTVQMSR